MANTKQVDKPTQNPTNTTRNVSYTDYAAAGLVVIPEKDKRPLKGLQWSKYYRENLRPTDDELLEWELSSGYGFGLLTGAPSGIVLLDIDHASDEQIKGIVEQIGDTPCKKFGTKGITLFYKYNGEQNLNFKNKDGVLIAELLSTGRKSTIPPTKLSNGTEYIWTGKPLLDCYTLLPTLPANYKEIIDSFFSITRTPPKYQDYHYNSFEKPDEAEVIKALSYCDPNCSNDDWVAIGMSLRQELGDAAFYEFDAWSQRGGKKYDKGSIRSRWRSFDSHSITIGTLFKFAQDGGYKFPPKHATSPAFTETLAPDEFTKLKLSERARKIEEAGSVHPIISNAPPLIKAMTQWIYSHAPIPQPMLSLGATLSTIGFLMGRDYACAKSGIKANLYNICVAGSQEGKEHVKYCCQLIMKEFGLLKNYRTKWTSGSAIENDMGLTDGQVYYITDEMGIMMHSLVGKYTSANQQEAVSILLQVYTEGFYKGKSYAKSADQKPIEIENPFIAVCGSTQREPFFEAMTSMQAFTGVLNRMCLFKAPDIRPEENLDYDVEKARAIPMEVKRALQDLSESIQYLKQGKTHKSVTKYVPYTEEAASALREYRKGVGVRFRESQLEGENIHLVIGRSAEVLEKLALIGRGGKVITLEVLEWAKSVVEYSTGIMISSLSQVVDNDYERKKFKFLEFLEKKGGAATLTEINNNFRGFANRHEKQSVIEDLKEGEKIKAVRLLNKTAYTLT